MGTYSIYPAAAPTGTTNFVNEGDVTVGNRFRSSVAGDVTHIRYFKSSTDNCTSHHGAIWSSAGTKLGGVTFTGETGGPAWQTMALGTPVTIAAGTTYVVTVNHDDGDYLTFAGYFGSTSWSHGGPFTGLNSGFDGVSGEYVYTTNLNTFPTTSGAGTGYFTDVIFDDGVTAGAEPKRRAVGALFAVASGTSITPVIPAGAVTNDIMLMGVMCNGSTTFTTPTDWTLLGTSIESNANQSTAWFWKRHDGSESNPTSTTSATLSTTLGGYGRIWAFYDCITSGDPFEDVTMAGTPTSSTTPQSAAIDTTDVDRLAVCIAMVDDDNQWTGVLSAGWFNAGPAARSTTGGDALFDAFSKVVPTAAAVGAVTVNTQAASDYWRTLTLALIPAPAAAGGPPPAFRRRPQQLLYR